MVNVERPIFILGPPRSGTSLLYKTLAVHPDLAWFNRNFKRLPEWPRLARFLTAVRNRPDVPQESSVVWNRFLTRDDDFMRVRAVLQARLDQHGFQRDDPVHGFVAVV